MPIKLHNFVSRIVGGMHATPPAPIYHGNADLPKMPDVEGVPLYPTVDANASTRGSGLLTAPVKRVSIGFPARVDWNSLRQDPRTPEEFAGDVWKYLRTKNYNPDFKNNVEGVVGSARKLLDQLMPATLDVIKALDEKFGRNNYRIVTLERGMRDARLALTQAYEKQGRDVGIVGLPASTWFFRKLFFQFKENGREVALQYLRQHDLDVGKILGDDKQVVLLDTGWWGQVTREVLELLSQSTSDAESDADYIKRIGPQLQNKKAVVVIGDGNFELSHLLVKSYVGLVDVFTDEYRRTPSNAWTFEELQQTVFPAMHPNLIQMLKEGDAVIVFADTDPSRRDSSYVSAFLKSLDIDTHLVIERKTSIAQTDLRQRVHQMLLISSNPNIPSLLDRDSYSMEELVKKLEHSPRPFKEVSEVELRDDNTVAPSLNYKDELDQAKDLIWQFALLKAS